MANGRIPSPKILKSTQTRYTLHRRRFRIRRRWTPLRPPDAPSPASAPSSPPASPPIRRPSSSPRRRRSRTSTCRLPRSTSPSPAPASPQSSSGTCCSCRRCRLGRPGIGGSKRSLWRSSSSWSRGRGRGGGARARRWRLRWLRRRGIRGGCGGGGRMRGTFALGTMG